MRQPLLLLVILVAVFATASCTQGAEPDEPATSPAAVETAAPPAPEDVAAAITQLERDWVAAIVKKDTAAIDRFLSDDFVGTSPTAHVYTKKMAIDDLASGAYVVESMDLDELSVNVYGDTAVAFASQQEKSRYGKADISGHYHYTDVWVKRDGRWQAVSSHGTRYDTVH